MGTAADDHQVPEFEPPMTSKSTIGEGSSQGFDFFASIVAGMVLGLGLDWILGTAPVLVIIGVIAGFVAGFVKLWVASGAIEEEARRRGRL
jgi:F0F1-type ATP synthase assembly protein I